MGGQACAERLEGGVKLVGVKMEAGGCVGMVKRHAGLFVELAGDPSDGIAKQHDPNGRLSCLQISAGV